MSRLALAALAAQALASLVIWQLVNDTSHVSESGVWGWSNDDFYQWRAGSVTAAAVLVVAAGAMTRRWWATSAVASGCLVGLFSGFTVFIGYAALHSA